MYIKKNLKQQQEEATPALTPYPTASQFSYCTLRSQTKNILTTYVFLSPSLTHCTTLNLSYSHQHKDRSSRVHFTASLFLLFNGFSLFSSLSPSLPKTENSTKEIK